MWWCVALFVYFVEVADSYIKMSTGLMQLANIDPGPLDKILPKVSDTLEKARVSFIRTFLNDSKLNF